MNIEQIRKLSMQYAKGELANETRRKIAKPGDPCGHCATPVLFRKHATPPVQKRGRAFYYESWLYCPSCNAVWFDPAKVRYFNKPAPTAPRVMGKRKPHRKKPWLTEMGKHTHESKPVAMPKTNAWTGTPTPEDQAPW